MWESRAERDRREAQRVRAEASITRPASRSSTTNRAVQPLSQIPLPPNPGAALQHAFFSPARQFFTPRSPVPSPFRQSRRTFHPHLSPFPSSHVQKLPLNPWSQHLPINIRLLVSPPPAPA